MVADRSFRARLDLARRVAAGFAARNRRPWMAEAEVFELTEQVSDLARHIMVAERYCLADRDADPHGATTTAELADELADVLYCVARLADRSGTDLEAAHVAARDREREGLHRTSGG